MQAGKNAAASAKETAGNVAASAKAGLDKTKATMQEKVDKMRAHDPAEKELATQTKEAKINQAEISKQEARATNAAEKENARAGHPVGEIHSSHVAPANLSGGGHTS